MGRKLNEKFVNNFIELDKLCCEKFGVASNGVTEYVNRLNNARFAPNRDEVLPELVKYRNLVTVLHTSPRLSARLPISLSPISSGLLSSRSLLRRRRILSPST